MALRTENRLLRDQAVCALICSSSGITAREIAKELNMDRRSVNRILYGSPLMQELCYQDARNRWHGLIRQTRPHAGLREISGYYALVRDFLVLSEDEWMEALSEGCRNIGRNLNDTRGLLHSFRDCRTQMLQLFEDLRMMKGRSVLDWEIAFELKLKRGRYVRIYADVLVMTESHVFSLEFKMKDAIEPEEVEQAAKYCPYLEILFGPSCDVIPVLVLTKSSDLYEFTQIGATDMLLPVCSGDMLFNVFDEYLGFLDE
ncbi:MAG: helix-turn-helix domain containing protein [Blautia sp.]|nr:helix-turn-helix domain containing protein [Blautia sp.]